MAKTTTSYFNSPKFDLTEWTALLSLWIHFMIDGLTATLYSIADWAEGQMMLQLGDLHEPNRSYPAIEPVEPVPSEPVELDPMIEPVEPVETVTIEPVEPVELDPLPSSKDLTYKQLQELLKTYRNDRGKINVKLNAKRKALEKEARSLGLIA